jgi:acyl-CoA hydrolase
MLAADTTQWRQFGGWIMSLMDSAGAMTAVKYAKGRVVTVAVSNIVLLQPVNVGDVVCCYADATKFGRTSIALTVEVWVLRQGWRERVKMTTKVACARSCRRRTRKKASVAMIPRRSDVPVHRDEMPSDTEVLQRMHNSEIVWSSAGFYDGELRCSLGDDLNGWTASGMAITVSAAVRALRTDRVNGKLINPCPDCAANHLFAEEAQCRHIPRTCNPDRRKVIAVHAKYA